MLMLLFPFEDLFCQIVYEWFGILPRFSSLDCWGWCRLKELSFVLILVHWWKNLLNGFFLIKSKHFYLYLIWMLSICLFGQFCSLQFFLFRLDLTNNINCTIWVIAENRSFWDLDHNQFFVLGENCQ